jgi:hypothetical protein
MPLPFFMLMGQSRHGVVQMLEAQVHPLIVAIPRFIQLTVPLPPLKLMDQSRRGVMRVFPLFDSPHAVIEPSSNGYTKIYSNYNAFAALKADGSIT